MSANSKRLVRSQGRAKVSGLHNAVNVISIPFRNGHSRNAGEIRCHVHCRASTAQMSRKAAPATTRANTSIMAALSGQMAHARAHAIRTIKEAQISISRLHHLGSGQSERGPPRSANERMRPEFKLR